MIDSNRNSPRHSGRTAAMLAAVAIGAATLTPSTAVFAGPPNAWVGGKILFGPQMGGQAAGPCSAITVTATRLNGVVVAHIPAAGAKAGAKQCGYRFPLAAGVPVTIAVKFQDLVSKPQGAWSNPLKPKGNSTGFDFLMDGKP